MKQIIPFKQELLFKTKISEITSISLEHTLSLKEEDLISGEFLISGDYKMTEGSINREKFSYNLPFEINLNTKYDISNIVIDIDNFYYEVINNESLLVNIDVYFEGEKLKEEEKTPQKEEIKDVRNDEYDYKDAIIEDEENNEEEISIVNEESKNIIEKNIDYKKIEKELELTDSHTDYSNITNKKEENILTNQKENNTYINNEFNLFENIDASDTYVTYHVYIVKEDDNIDTIVDKYGVTKEEITNYNDITTINPGDKIVIPNKNE